MKENKFAAARMKIFLVTRMPVMSFFFGLKRSGKTKQRNKKCELCQYCTQNVLSVYFPVPNNSPPRLLIFQILFCRYFKDC